MRPRDWLTLDVAAGTRLDAEQVEAGSVLHAGAAARGEGVALFGRADYAPEHGVSAVVGLEVEW